MNNDPNPQDSYEELPPLVRQVALEMLLSERPEDKRRLDRMEQLSRQRGLSFESLITEALERFVPPSPLA